MRSGAIKRRTGKAVAWLLAGLLVGGGAGAGAMYLVKRQKTAIGGDASLATADEVSMVPADALGFAHARLAELWKSDAMESFRKVVEKAGPQAAATLDASFVPAPSSLDRVTVVFMPGEGRGGDPQAFALFAFSSSFDAEDLRKSIMPHSEKAAVGDKSMWVAPGGDMAAHFPKDKLLVIGQIAAVRSYLSKTPAAEGPLASAIKEAAGGTRHVVAAVNMSKVPIPPGAFDSLPPDIAPLLKAEAFSLGVAITTDAKVELRAVYKDEQAAADAEKSVKAAADMGLKALAEPKKQMEEMLNGPAGTPKPRPFDQLPQAVGGLVGLGGIKTVEEYLLNPPVKRNGNELAATINVPSLGGAYLGMAGMSAGLMLPAVQKVRDAATRVEGSNNLKMMGLAMHNHHDVNGKLPPTSWGTKIEKENGKPTGKLSWRVAILPYVEEDNLYRQFKHDEPWDSEHNKKLIDKMPKIYATPRAMAPPGMTYYKVFTTAPKSKFRTMFDKFEGRSLVTIPDGTSNTIMIVEGGEPVTWTKPDDIEYDTEKPLPKLGLPGFDVITVCLGDGSTRTINLKAISEKTLRNAITGDDGEVLGQDW